MSESGVKKVEKQKGREFLECWCISLAISNVKSSVILRIYKFRYFGVIGVPKSELVIVRIPLFWRVCNLLR